MAVQPAPAQVLALTPSLGDPDGADLTRALETERSAGKALLSALRELEANLAAERRRVIDLEVEKVQVEEAMKTGASELDRQRKVTTGLFAQLEEARAALEDERNKTFLRRLLNR